MINNETAIRLECLKLAESAQRAGDKRDLIAIAEEIFKWVTAGGVRESRVRAPRFEAQTFLPLDLPERVSRRPTIKEMVKILLEEAYPNGMTALQILAEIQKRWFSSLERTSLSPQLSRLKIDEEIIHEHGFYRLNKQDAPSDDSDGAS